MMRFSRIGRVTNDGFPMTSAPMTKLADKARWYKNRLAAMSGAEILHRLHEAARRRIDAHRQSSFAALAQEASDTPLPSIPNFAAGLDAWNVPHPLLLHWDEEARAAKAGQHEIFGQTWPQVPRAEMWHIAPVSGASWPRDIFCFDIDYRHGGVNAKGDVKFVWELNRLQYLQPIAALARKRGDRKLAQFCLSEIESWIDGNPPFLGVNWNSGIELALRAVSILTVTSFVGETATQAQRDKIMAILETHARWIARYPSLYSSANNHRAAEGLGLFMIGALCPAFAQSPAWRDTGWIILQDAAEKQISPDGAGAEQAVAYAASLLETLLAGFAVAHGCGIAVPDAFKRKLTLAAEYLRWLCDARGNVPAIGDDDNACVFGHFRPGDTYAASVAGCVAALTRRPDLSPPHVAPHLRNALFGLPPVPDFTPCGLRDFAHGGLAVGRHQREQGDILIAFDHGPLGYLSIAAHGHADALAVWLHIGGRPVLVDAGTCLYHAAVTNGNDGRAHFRGTAAHNTLTIAGENSSAMAGAFNWSRKASCTLRGIESRGDYWRAEAEHDGYLENLHVLHRRNLSVSPASGAVIEDWLAAESAQHVELAFLLHPGLAARREGNEILVFAGDDLLLRLRHESPLHPMIGDGWHSPRFGMREKTVRLSFSGLLQPEQKAVTQLYWSF
jgi:uncharacterized heparinase superfamily protein